VSTAKRGLGKGLESLLSSTISTAKREAASVTATVEHHTSAALVSGKTIVSVSIEDIIPNPNQPRHKFNDNTLNELAQSIKDHGIAQPILVRKRDNKYELIAGERRWRASKIVGLKHIPAIIKEMSDEESLEIAIIENIQREDLNAIDEAESYALLMDKFNLNQEEAAQKVGKARSSVANALRLLDLPDEIRESLRNGELTAGHARAILAAGEPENQLKLWNIILKEKISVREAEKLASKKIKEPAETTAAETNKIVEKPIALIETEQSLSSKFGTKVALSGTEQKGKIEIQYFSREDLDRIYELLM